MREVEPPTKPTRVRDGSASALRRELTLLNAEQGAGRARQVTRGGTTIYQQEGRGHGNFLEPSYRRICAHPTWFKRLAKAHTGKRQGTRIDARSDAPRDAPWRELDSANSSDALLMNIFCYPRVLAGERLPLLLGVERGLEPVFGYKPRVPMQGRMDTTEIDMRLGSLLVEAKLTEAVFPSAPVRKVERYRDFDAVFAREALVEAGEVRSYQVVRGVLAAFASDCSFALMCDRRRPEMLAAWEEVARAVKLPELRTRMKLVTWQEIAAVMPVSVQGWLRKKYGILPG